MIERCGQFSNQTVLNEAEALNPIRKHQIHINLIIESTQSTEKPATNKHSNRYQAANKYVTAIEKCMRSKQHPLSLAKSHRNSKTR